MTSGVSRRRLLQSSSLAIGAGLLPSSAFAASAPEQTGTIHLNLNENAFGPSPNVQRAIQAEFSRLNRYADAALAQALAEEVASYEKVPVEQIVLGEILGALGLSFGSKGGPGGEFIYSTPGYLALVDAASHLGGVGVPVPLDKEYRNDLDAIASRVNSKTRAIYLINPHNPTGTVSDDEAFKSFLRSVSERAPVIVDEAYLEYTPDFERRSAVSLVKDGANVLVFRTFDKIHGLAGLPIGYSIVPRALGEQLRKQGLGDAEGLGRLNIAAASAALADRNHVTQVRAAVATERQRWNALLDDLKLKHSDANGDFVFFNVGVPLQQLADALRADDILIGRAFPPYDTWARITIGTPAENRRVQQSVKRFLQRRS